MEILSLVANLSAAFGVLFLVWDKVRAYGLRATYDGTFFKVPCDEVKEAYRRAALAEASRLAGGRRVNLTLTWVGNTLVIKSQD